MLLIYEEWLCSKDMPLVVLKKGIAYVWGIIDGSSSVRYSSIGCLSVGVIIYGATRLSIYIYSGSH